MSDLVCTQVAFVDDDPDLRLANLQSLAIAGLDASAYESAEDALAAISDDFPGVVVADIRMPGMDGLELFRRLGERDPDLPVILISGHADVPTAVAAVQRGAYDFLAKPYLPERLVSSVNRALEKRGLIIENRRLRERTRENLAAGPLLGTSSTMERLRRTIAQIADVNVDVLVEGETGTGKGVVASMLHDLSSRSRRPMVTVDCGALPDTLVESELFGHVSGAFSGAHPRTGRIEQAHRSTLFLDEVETMRDGVQQKLQRVLETREITPLGANQARAVDLRVVCASKVELSGLVQRGMFAASLFYRLNGLTLRLPPLRERREDIPLLFSVFMTRTAERLARSTPKLTAAIWRRLKKHDWPGNVRELQHFAEHVVLGLESEETGYRMAHDARTDTLKARVAQFEAALIEETLAAANGDLRAALNDLGLPRKTFYDKINRLGIDLARFKPPRA